KDGKRVSHNPEDEDENDQYVIQRRNGAKAGEPIPYPHSCTECHEFDVDRRYMKPINYEKHCQRCHQLGYDSEKTIEKRNPETGEWETVADQVPHETTDIVRGYLAKVYNLDTLDTKSEDEDDQPNADNPLAELRRGFPGRDFEASFTNEQAQKIYEKISDMEKEDFSLGFLKNEIKRRKMQGVLLKENGGCALCHEVKKYDTLQAAKEAKVSPPRPWVIVKPNIPDRWYKHSWFRHDSHRMVSCVECHFDMKTGDPIYNSANTGDVLMPKRESCVLCHRTGPAKVVGAGDSHLLGARADCVECHGYHDYSKEDVDGKLDLGLRPHTNNSTATQTEHGSK
ncbi:MAG: cytochrome c3 family protein, partial [Planctomycetaceae bacterium]|nr:cytochrome c3 family protein [Planctomycetaceae bacterium]